MEKEKLESLLIDYIDGNLGDADRALVEKELQHENTAKLYSQLKEVMGLMDNSKTKIPGLSLKQNFEKALQAEISKSESALPAKAPIRDEGRQAGFLSAVGTACGCSRCFSYRWRGHWRSD